MDYVGAPPQVARNDGRSLRRFIDNTSWNKLYDERVVVVESDKRIPMNSQKYSAETGDSPSFSVRKGNWKLIVPKLRDSKVPDMMYNLQDDPYEMNNLLYQRFPTDNEIGKAEHLKVSKFS